MRIFENRTDGLRHLLRIWSRESGDAAWITFLTAREKLPALDAKWAETFGTHLPAHVRHARRQKGQPVAFALAHPEAGQPGKWRVWLIRTAGDLGPPQSPWRRENWNSARPHFGPQEIGMQIVREPRPRGDWAYTWKLTDKHINQIGQAWRAAVERGDGQELRFLFESAVSGLPMFGGVRRQIVKEVERQARRWAHKWPNRACPISAAKVPRMGRFSPGQAAP